MNLVQMKYYHPDKASKHVHFALYSCCILHICHLVAVLFSLFQCRGGTSLMLNSAYLCRVSFFLFSVPGARHQFSYLTIFLAAAPLDIILFSSGPMQFSERMIFVFVFYCCTALFSRMKFGKLAILYELGLYRWNPFL